MSVLPTAAVIICSRNRPDFLREAVDSVLSGDTLPAEIVIVDQSDQRHEALAERSRAGACEIRYLWDPARGVSRARNRGLQTARSEVVVFTDDDVYVDRGWLAAMVGSLSELGSRGVVTGRVLAAPSETRGGWAPALVHADQGATYEGRIGRDVLEAGNMAVFRSTLASVGASIRGSGPAPRIRPAKTTTWVTDCSPPAAGFATSPPG